MSIVNKKSFFIFYLLLLAGSLLSAQPTNKFRAVKWSVDDGLSMEAYNVMLKDSYGFMWIGSTYDVLQRFDGLNFKKYHPDKEKPGSIGDYRINGLIEDSLKNIWIGTGSGLSRYDIRADSFMNFVSVTDSLHSSRQIIPFWATGRDVYCLEAGSRFVKYDIRSFQKKSLLSISEADKIMVGVPFTNYIILDTLSNSFWILEGNPENPGGGLMQISLVNGKRQHFEWSCFRNIPNHNHFAEGMRLDRKRNSIWINSRDGLLEFSLEDKQFRLPDAWRDLIKLKNYDRAVGIDFDKDGRICIQCISNRSF